MAYSINSTIKEVINNPRAAEILEKYFPGAAESPMLKIAYSMKLSKICSFPQSNMSKEKIEQMDAQLREIQE